MTLRFGAGAGSADTGLSYLTTDVGVSFGWTFLQRLRPYAGISVALSGPTNRGPAVGNEDDIPRRPDTTLWAGGSMGLAWRVVEGLDLGIEGFLDLGWSPANNQESGIGLGAVGIVRYTFGAPR